MDNSESQVGTPSFEVTGDQDYVVAYGIRGNLVEYTVNYQDTDGNTLRESETYRGNVGDYMVVAYLYIEGYQPQAYNLGRTLSENAAQNIFTFVYTPVTAESGGGTTGGTTGGGGTGGGAAGGDAGEAGAAAAPAPAAAAGAAPGAGGAVAAGPGAAAGGAADGAVDAGGAADAGETVPDEEVPQAEGPDDLVDLDDEEVPLAGIGGEAGPDAVFVRNMATAVAVAGVGGISLAALFVLWMKKRRQDKGKKAE